MASIGRNFSKTRGWAHYVIVIVIVLEKPVSSFTITITITITASLSTTDSPGVIEKLPAPSPRSTNASAGIPLVGIDTLEVRLDSRLRGNDGGTVVVPVTKAPN